MTLQERTDKMLAHVSAQAQSGMSRKAYCEQNALKPHVLNYWCARSRKSEMAPGFAPVEVSHPDLVGVTARENMELHYPNGVRLLLPAGTALQHVAAWIRLY